MPVYTSENIRGYQSAEGVFCARCFTGTINNEVEIIEDKKVEGGEHVYVCDECGDQL
jgi:hypothetical protein